MGLLSWLRRLCGGFTDDAAPSAASHPGADEPAGASPASDEEWEVVPAFVPASPEDRAIPSVVALAVAAGDQPSSEFSVRSVEVANEEARVVGAIALAVAAGDAPTSEFVIRRVLRKKGCAPIRLPARSGGARKDSRAAEGAAPDVRSA